MSVMLVFDWARSGLGSLLIVAGSLLMLGGVLGLLRFPDVFTRLHAAGGALPLGACLSLLGLLVVSSSVWIAAKLAFLIVLILALAPVLAQIVGGAAHAAGISPIVGAYTAPRPDARNGARTGAQ